MVGEKLLCGFQWDMSGIDVHANTDIGRHTSTLVRTLVTTISSESEGGHEKQRTHKSSSNLPSPKSQSVRHVRKVASTAKVMHKRSFSVHQRPSQDDTNYKNVLEQQLAKQTRRVQHMRYTGATVDSLKMEEAILRSTEQELARTVQRMFRHPRTGLTLQAFNQLFSPRSVVSSHERSGSVGAAVRTRLFSATEPSLGKEEVGRGSSPSSPLHVTSSKTKLGLGHRRYKSDVTGIRADSPSPIPIMEAGEDVKSDAEEVLLEEAPEEGTESSPVKPPGPVDGFSLPSIDLEFDVTVNVDHGKIVLRTEER